MENNNKEERYNNISPMGAQKFGNFTLVEIPIISSLPKSPQAACCLQTRRVFLQEYWPCTALWPANLTRGRHLAQNESIIFSETQRLNRRVLALKLQNHEELLPKLAAWQPKTMCEGKETKNLSEKQNNSLQWGKWNRCETRTKWD